MSVAGEPYTCLSVNFNAHILVAGLVEWLEPHRPPSEPEVSAAEPADLVSLGSALPDLASIAGCRLVNEPKNRWLRQGIELHHSTDSAFHNHEWFLARQGDLLDRLQGRGLERGPARACAHVGIELLIDGYLLRTRSGLTEKTRSGFGTIPAIIAVLSDLPVEERKTRWVAFLHRSDSWPQPHADDYRPQAVAERLHRILEPRRRLRFATTQIDVVAEVLTGLVDDLEQETEALVADVVSTVNADQPRSPSEV